MRRFIRRFICLFLIVSSLFSVPAYAAGGFYQDVPHDCWSYPYIFSLQKQGIFPVQDILGRAETENRANFVSYLYRLYLNIRGKVVLPEQTPFTDVPENHPQREAILWAESVGIIKGISETLFAPEANITRQDASVMMMRFARYANLRLGLLVDAEQFRDSLLISDYARSDVAACQMAGIINGYEDRFFRPEGRITREECAALVSRLIRAMAQQGKAVSLEEGAYDSLYEFFEPLPDAKVPACDPVDLSYFENTVFIGDSVSQALEFYCAGTAALGKAKFLCAGSLSATNALFPVTPESVHPYWNGEKMLVEDGVAASEASIVYIMLGMNNISSGVDKASGDMVLLIERILEKSPDVQIVIQSVTPMTKDSPILGGSLNNDVIMQYNDRMRQICLERGWYYVDVQEVLKDEEGCLPLEYCSDPAAMGIHFTFTAAAVWVDYLKTHVPAALMQ